MKERIITMKLLYYDDKTPEDYQPKFFQACQGICNLKSTSLN